jgi:hypothetical protein
MVTDTSYAPYGELKFVGGKVICHICGDEWDALQAHIWQTHEMRAAEYRSTFGIPNKVGLLGPDSSERRRRAMAKRMLEDPGMMRRIREHPNTGTPEAMAKLAASVKATYDDGRRVSSKVTVRCRWCDATLQVWPANMRKVVTTTCGDRECVRKQKVAVGQDLHRREREKYHTDADYRAGRLAVLKQAGLKQAAERRKPDGACIVCGKPGLRHPRRTCSEACLFENRRRVASRKEERGCEVEGCERDFLARGKCALHYQRARSEERRTSP